MVAKSSSPKGPQTREDRLKARLKSNLARRKDQARARKHAAEEKPTEKTKSED